MSKYKILHKNKDIALYLVYTVSSQNTQNPKKEQCLMGHSIHYSRSIYNCLWQMKLCEIFTHTAIRHILAILISVFMDGYRGKTVDFGRHSPVPPDNGRPFPEQGEMGPQEAGGHPEGCRHSGCICRGHPIWEARFLHCGRHHCLKDGAFVTGAAPN